MELKQLKHAKRLFLKRRAMPEQLTLFTTTKCNLRCKHCFAWKELNNPRIKELTSEEIELTSRSMSDFLYLLLGGGEPFFRKDLPEIVDSFYRNNNILVTAISTNGTLTEEIIKATKRILKNYENHLIINVSIDAIGKTHDGIRGRVGVFDAAVKTINNLKNLKSEFSNLDVGVIMTCTPFNQNLEDAYRFVRDSIKPDSIVLNYMRGEVREQTDKKVDLEIYDKVAKEIERDNMKKRVVGHYNFQFSTINLASKILTRELISKTIRENRYQTRCYAGILNAVLFPNGDLYPCELLSRKFGNIRDVNYNFKKLWFSKEAYETRKWIKNTNCFCTEECNTNMNILFNPRYIPKIFKKVIRIKLTRMGERER